MWDESDLVRAERYERYHKRLGGLAPDVVKILTETPEHSEATKTDASRVHVVGVSVFERSGQASSALELWPKVGYTFGGPEAPTGKQLRAFADQLPEL
jgi:hypothetical protein